MPWRTPRACPRCGALLAPGGCPVCRAGPDPYDRQAWRRLSQTFRARFPFCGQRADGGFHPEHSDCARRGRQVLADQVDHIRPFRAGDDLYDEANLQSLCVRCHRRKTVTDRWR
jgi:5-methylcytosine-specific restriction protein A